ncbi:MAG: hypothetical protein WC006_05965 [Bacilli bacterium]|nr:hypothetical protein [Bacilli bacterium]
MKIPKITASTTDSIKLDIPVNTANIVNPNTPAKSSADRKIVNLIKPPPSPL